MSMVAAWPDCLSFSAACGAIQYPPVRYFGFDMVKSGYVVKISGKRYPLLIFKHMQKV
jgi:hypothetical protein